jgi:ABC-type phosphate transport system substrate-binding protein
MDMSLQKRFRSGPLAVLVGLSVLGCCVLANLVFASVSSAAEPLGGSKACQTDGKINGRGSTYQILLQEAFKAAYRNDFCGEVGTASSEQGEAGNTMVAYDYPEAEKASGTGSGNGIKAASCRTDAFAGTDTPYTEAQLSELDGVPGKTGGCSITFTPPFQPNSPASWPDKEAGKEDTEANIMTVPIGGSSVALALNLTAADCGGTAPSSELKFNAKEVSRIFGGAAATWSDSELVASNPSLSNCTGAITRVVREDSSGTTNIFKSYLIRAENERTTQKCAEGKKWSAYFTTNTEWPGKQKPGEEGTCSAITNAATSGNPALIAKLKETPDGVGYADLPQVINQPGLIIASVQNATGTSFQTPNIGEAANCNYSVLSLPGAGPSEAVGLDPEDNWANNNEEVNKEPNHGNATDLGSKYPICGITWDMVYTGLSNTSGGANPISRLSADQRRTLYSYFTFILSSTAQHGLSSIYYAPLPTTWLGLLTEGFQGNF